MQIGRRLNPYAVITRYPDDFCALVLDRELAQEAIEHAINVHDFVKGKIKA